MNRIVGIVYRDFATFSNEKFQINIFDKSVNSIHFIRDYLLKNTRSEYKITYDWKAVKYESLLDHFPGDRAFFGSDVDEINSYWKEFTIDGQSTSVTFRNR